MTFKDLIENFVGSGNFVAPLAEQGAREVIDILPSMYLMRTARDIELTSTASDWYWNTSEDFTHNAGGPDTKRLLKVMRHDGLQWRECIELDFLLFSQAANTRSLYLATENSPVYNIDINSWYPILKVLPAITGSANAADSGKVIFVPYPDFSDAESWNYIDSGDSNNSVYTLFRNRGFSMDATNIMALKGSLYITQKLISDAVQDDEDNELLAMLNAQQASLNAQYEMDMKRLMGVAE